MRIIARSTLRKFWQHHADAERPLIEWYALVSKAKWSSPATLKLDIRTASILKEISRCIQYRWQQIPPCGGYRLFAPMALDKIYWHPSGL